MVKYWNIYPKIENNTRKALTLFLLNVAYKGLCKEIEERSQNKRGHTVWFHFYEVQQWSKLIYGIEIRIIFASGRKGQKWKVTLETF